MIFRIIQFCLPDLISSSIPIPTYWGAESMVVKFHGNVRGEVRVNFLALFASKPHIFMCGALKLSGIVRANFCLNIAIPMLFWSLTYVLRELLEVLQSESFKTQPRKNE